MSVQVLGQKAMSVAVLLMSRQSAKSAAMPSAFSSSFPPFSAGKGEAGSLPG